MAEDTAETLDNSLNITEFINTLNNLAVLSFAQTFFNNIYRGLGYETIVLYVRHGCGITLSYPFAWYLFVLNMF